MPYGVYPRSYPKTTTVDVTFFDEWNPQMAFTLGYLWADGWVTSGRRGNEPNKIGMECVEEDKEVILGIKEAMKSKHKLGYRPAKKRIRDGKVSWEKPQVSVQITNKQLAMKLVTEFGILPNKSEQDLP